MIRIRQITAYVVDHDRAELRHVNMDWPHETVAHAWEECARLLMFHSPRYRDRSPETDAEFAHWQAVEKRLARLLAFWNRERAC